MTADRLEGGKDPMRRVKITGAFLAGFALLALAVSRLMVLMSGFRMRRLWPRT